MVKTLILDIDNTLIEAMKELPLRSEAALRRWLAAGHRLVFASGKNACAFDDLIALLRMQARLAYCFQRRCSGETLDRSV